MYINLLFLCKKILMLMTLDNSCIFTQNMTFKCFKIEKNCWIIMVKLISCRIKGISFLSIFTPSYKEGYYKQCEKKLYNEIVKHALQKQEFQAFQQLVATLVVTYQLYSFTPPPFLATLTCQPSSSTSRHSFLQFDDKESM